MGAAYLFAVLTVIGVGALIVYWRARRVPEAVAVPVPAGSSAQARGIR
jgi:hypothetical protein